MYKEQCMEENSEREGAPNKGQRRGQLRQVEARAQGGTDREEVSVVSWEGNGRGQDNRPRPHVSKELAEIEKMGRGQQGRERERAGQQAEASCQHERDEKKREKKFRRATNTAGHAGTGRGGEDWGQA